MGCFEDILYSRYLDEELSLSEKKKIEAHFKECKKCKNLLQKMEGENKGITDLFKVDHKMTNLTPIIMNKINKIEEEPFQNKWNLFKRFKWGLVIAATIILFTFL